MLDLENIFVNQFNLYVEPPLKKKKKTDDNEENMTRDNEKHRKDTVKGTIVDGAKTGSS